jgi:hypothetical protein
MTPLPKPLASSDPFAVAFNQLIACIKERTVRSSPTVKVRQLQTCVTLDAAAESVPGEPGDGMRWKGEYNSDLSYEEGDVVVVRGGGPGAGSYVANKAVPAGNPPSYPDLGEYWVSFRPPEVVYWT